MLPVHAHHESIPVNVLPRTVASLEKVVVGLGAVGRRDTVTFDHGTTVIIGLDLPFAANVAALLRARGVNLPSTLMSEQELVDRLWTLHSNK